MAGWSRMMNRHTYEDDLEASPWLAVYRELADIFYRADPVGLRQFPCLPYEEYGPEALRIIAALVIGDAVDGGDWIGDLFRSIDAALLSSTKPRELSYEELKQLTEKAFDDMFGDCHEIESGVIHEVAEALEKHGLLLLTENQIDELRGSTSSLHQS